MSLKVDYDEVNKLSNRTKTYKDEFETIRQKFLELVGNLDECWQGGDSNIYRLKFELFLNYLSNETDSLRDWEEFFGRASRMYGNTEEEWTSKIDSVEKQIADNNKRSSNRGDN